MFGIFGGGIPSAQSLLSPINFVNNLYKQPVAAPVAPTYYNLPPDTTHYTDYKKFNFGNPLANLNTKQLGVNPGMINSVPMPTTNPMQNQYSWGAPAQSPAQQPKPATQPFKPMTAAEINNLVKSINSTTYGNFSTAPKTPAVKAKPIAPTPIVKTTIATKAK